MACAEIQNFYMADVAHKPENYRKAVASGILACGKQAFHMLIEKQLPKGDAFAVAELAGMMATKNTPALIPLCHPLEILKAQVRFEPLPQTFEVKVICEVSAIARTGVEMEALTGVTAALLSLYDLIKPIEPALQMHSILLEVKEGGKSGLWTREKHLQEKDKADKSPADEKKLLSGLDFAIITVSDTCHAKKAEDLSGPTLNEQVQKFGGKTVFTLCVPDESESITNAINQGMGAGAQVILLTGGTGIGPRDVTPEALMSLGGKDIPGLGELLRQNGAKYTNNTWLSRAKAIILNKTLIIAFPGKPAACVQGLTAMVSIIKHAMAMISGEKHADDLRRSRK